ncbi:hypothetical protein GDO86_003702 [Hymenochirus boettgeri]|uniref:Orn/DAP/Arg decarboxylase 2 N-terminal domain-containing protein n=1 Tax=Hymenochirus boettgeri TaxID=247094 RepID=A0A8T2KAS9_9PIPI|nr:hypothetical protein GDO86_003702 [Hymenochirus boettgeri]
MEDLQSGAYKGFCLKETNGEKCPEDKHGSHTVTPLGWRPLTLLDKGMSAQLFLKKKIENNLVSGDQDAFFVADLGDVVQKHWRFKKELPRVKPFYAVKCNSSKEVLQTLAVLGAGFDCASMGEMEMILRMGVPATDIIYANTCKQVSHIKYAAKHGIHRMTFDCENELVKLSTANPHAEMVLRIKTDDSGSWHKLSSKFGAHLQDCENLLKKANSLNIKVIGVSFHFGSVATVTASFSKAIEDAKKVFDIGKKLGHCMKVWDIGGGFPGESNFNPIFEEVLME